MIQKYCRIALRAIASILLLAPFLMVSHAVAQEPTPKPLTVPRIWSEPSLSGRLTQGVEWSPDGRFLSFLAHSNTGQEELWALEPRSGQRHLLVSTEILQALLPSRKRAPNERTGLGRATPKQYFWAPDSKGLLFLHEGTLVWLDLPSKQSRTLVAGESPISDPKISGDGRWLAFVQDHNLRVVNVASGEVRSVTKAGSDEVRDGELDWVYPEELGIRTAFWWSPDSASLAFLELDERPVTRYPVVDFLSYDAPIHWLWYPRAGEKNPVARVGVISLSGGQPRWMDTGSDSDIYIPRVAWLPDSRRLAIERLNRAQTRLDLLFADADSGRSTVILSEEDRAWVNVLDDPYFLAGGKGFLWQSERSGFRHIYRYDLDGKRVAPVTSGDWEVTELAAVDEATGSVYFVSGKQDPLERQLFRVALDGSGLTQITKAAGTHVVQVSPSSDFFLDTYSNAMTPPRQDVLRADGSSAAILNANQVPELADYRLSPVEFFTVPGADGTPLYAMMIKPPGFDPARKYPVLVHVYGGPGVQSLHNAWGGQNFLWHELMAQKGFLIFELDNRGTSGRGHAFETPVNRHFGGADLDDQLAGVSYLRTLPFVDSSRIGIWGWSYGGHMTLQAMFRGRGAFRAGFAGAPVTDWRQYDTIYTERYLGRPQDNADVYRTCSPVSYAAGLQGKLLMAHGTSDDNVKFANTAELADTLIRAGKYAEIAIYPGRRHPTSDPAARIQLFERVTQFFMENLQAP